MKNKNYIVGSLSNKWFDKYIMAKEIIITLDVVLAKRKMKLGVLADKIDIHINNLSILKNGKARAIRMQTLLSLCEALECTPNDLFEIRETTEANAGMPVPGNNGKEREDLLSEDNDV
jgi:putative transcriptional regulator